MISSENKKNPLVTNFTSPDFGQPSGIHSCINKAGIFLSGIDLATMKLLLTGIVFIVGTVNMLAQNSLNASIKRGEVLYMGFCASCHLAEGQGIESVFPPLADSDYLMADRKRSIAVVIRGMEGEIVVNGITYNNIMTPLGLNDKEVADVLNFVRNSWGNEGGWIKVEEVSGVRDSLHKR